MAKIINPATLELTERTVATNRVSKTVKGGRIARQTAIMVVGDGNGHVGYGLGKAAEYPEAIRKGIEDAKKNIIEVSLKGTSIPHEVIGVYGAARVLLKPAAPGTGIIAGGTVRAVVEWQESRISVLNVCAPAIPQTWKRLHLRDSRRSAPQSRLLLCAV